MLGSSVAFSALRGSSGHPPGSMDGESVIGWSGDGKRHSAWMNWRVRRSGEAMGADITLYSNIFTNYRMRGIDAQLELRKTMVYELGHVLGLTHSDIPGDAMSVKVRTRPEWKQPSENDIARCQTLYPGLLR